MVAQAAAVILDVQAAQVADANPLVADVTPDVLVAVQLLHHAAADLLDAMVAVPLDHLAVANQPAARKRVVDC